MSLRPSIHGYPVSNSNLAEDPFIYSDDGYESEWGLREKLRHHSIVTADSRRRGVSGVTEARGEFPKISLNTTRQTRDPPHSGILQHSFRTFCLIAVAAVTLIFFSFKSQRHVPIDDLSFAPPTGPKGDSSVVDILSHHTLRLEMLLALCLFGTLCLTVVGVVTLIFLSVNPQQGIPIDILEFRLSAFIRKFVHYFARVFIAHPPESTSTHPKIVSLQHDELSGAPTIGPKGALVPQEVPKISPVDSSIHRSQPAPLKLSPPAALRVPDPRYSKATLLHTYEESRWSLSRGTIRYKPVITSIPPALERTMLTRAPISPSMPTPQTQLPRSNQPAITRAYKSHSSMNKHHSSHFQAANLQSTRLMSDERLPEEIPKQTPSSARNVTNRTSTRPPLRETITKALRRDMKNSTMDTDEYHPALIWAIADRCTHRPWVFPPVSPFPEDSVYAVRTGFRAGVFEYNSFRSAVNGYEPTKVRWAVFDDTKYAVEFVKTGLCPRGVVPIATSGGDSDRLDSATDKLTTKRHPYKFEKCEMESTLAKRRPYGPAFKISETLHNVAKDPTMHPVVLQPQYLPPVSEKPAKSENYTFASISHDNKNASINMNEFGLDFGDEESVWSEDPDEDWSEDISCHDEWKGKYAHRLPPSLAALPIMGGTVRSKAKGWDMFYPSGVRKIPTASVSDLLRMGKGEGTAKRAVVARSVMEQEEEQADIEYDPAEREQFPIRYASAPLSLASPAKPLARISPTSLRTIPCGSVGPKPVPETVSSCVAFSRHTYHSLPHDPSYTTLKPSRSLLVPTLISQLGPPDGTKLSNQCIPPAHTPPNAQYSSVSISSSSLRTVLDHATQHESSPKHELELVTSSTRANTIGQLVEVDRLSKPESIQLNPAACDLSENRKLACGIGTDHPVAGTETHGTLRQLDQFDDSSALLPPDARTDLASNPTLDLRARITKPHDWDGGSPMDIGAHEDKNKVIAFVATDGDLGTTPVIFRVCDPVVEQNPGSLDPPTSTEAFESSKPDKQQVDERSPSPLSESHNSFRHLTSIPTGKHSFIFTAAVERFAVLRPPGEHCQPDPVRPPEMSINLPLAARSRRQRLRTIRVLALLYYHSLSWEPGGSSVPFNCGDTSGSSQAPGGIDLRLEDRSGIWSGQGPGPESSLQGQEEPLDWQDILELLGQGQNISPSKPTHDPITSSIPEQPDYLPRPPVPLAPYSEGYSAGHAAGYSAGYSDGVAQVYAALARYMESTIKPLIDQKALMQGLESFTHPSLAALAATDISNTVLLAGLDGPAPTEPVMTVNSESQPEPNLERQSITPNCSDGLPQNLAIPIAFNAEQQLSVLDADHNSGPNRSDLGVALNPGVQPPDSFDSLIPYDSRSRNSLEVTPMPAPQTQPSQSNQQHSASPEPTPILAASPGHENTKTHKHQCETCGKSFRRPYLLEDHKRTHHDGEASTYSCKFEGCTRFYNSHSNMHRHYKSHLKKNNSRSPPPTSNEQVPVEISEQPPVAGPSTHNARSRASGYRSDRGTYALSGVRFRPYETPDTLRPKAVQHQK